jgi:hypothetical protein
VSCISTVRVSPELMKRSLLGSGVKPTALGSAIRSFGFAGACETPFLVMNAKLTYSSPVCGRQVGLLFRLGLPTGKLELRERLSMLSAAHHFVASQLSPAGQAA